MRARMSRRRFLRSILGSALGAAAWPRQASADLQALDNYCYFRTESGPHCFGDGTLRVYRCYICCSAGNCQVVFCEWHVIGSC